MLTMLNFLLDTKNAFADCESHLWGTSDTMIPHLTDWSYTQTYVCFS